MLFQSVYYRDSDCYSTKLGRQWVNWIINHGSSFSDQVLVTQVRKVNIFSRLEFLIFLKTVFVSEKRIFKTVKCWCFHVAISVGPSYLRNWSYNFEEQSSKTAVWETSKVISGVLLVPEDSWVVTALWVGDSKTSISILSVAENGRHRSKLINLCSVWAPRSNSLLVFMLFYTFLFNSFIQSCSGKWFGLFIFLEPILLGLLLNLALLFWRLFRSHIAGVWVKVDYWASKWDNSVWARLHCGSPSAVNHELTVQVSSLSVIGVLAQHYM